MNVSDRLAQLMEERKLTIYSLAQTSGLHWQTIKNLFTRTSNPSVATLTSICDGLGIAMAQFFAEEGETTITLTADQQYLLDRWNNISQDDKKIISSMLNVMLRTTQSPIDGSNDKLDGI